jgi:hypothetical protein
MGSSPDYVQPTASHRQHPERLLLRDDEGQCYLWFGDGREMEAVPASLAAWICDRPEMYQLQAPLLWFDRESLPMDTAAF